MSEVTRLLDAIHQGDSNAADRLLPMVYEELRQLAAHKMANEAPGQTLQPTALVHEAWLRLGGDQQPAWHNRAHFFAAVGEAMRRILIEQARRKARRKRGGHPPMEEFHESRIEIKAPADEVLAVHEALDQLAAEDAAAADVVKLRYFAGLSIPQVAQALNIAPRTADRLWAFARVRLKQALREEKLR